MLFHEDDDDDCLLMDLSSTSDDESSDEQSKPGAIDLPHDFSLVSQPVQLTPFRSRHHHLKDEDDDDDEQDLFFISDADSVSRSYSPGWKIHDDPFVVEEDQEEGPRKRFKRDHDVYISPVSVCTIAQPFHSISATPYPPILHFANEDKCSETSTATLRFHQQLAILSQRMRQSEESRQKVTEHRQKLAHIYESVTRPETSLFTTSKIASEYYKSREALFSTLHQVMMTNE